MTQIRITMTMSSTTAYAADEPQLLRQSLFSLFKALETGLLTDMCEVQANLDKLNKPTQDMLMKYLRSDLETVRELLTSMKVEVVS